MFTNTRTAAPGATQSAQDQPELPTEDEASYSTSESPEGSRKNRGLLHVPSRSSSQKIQPSPTSTGLSGATVSDPTDSIGGQSKESKGSTMGRRRNGSAASSKRSGTSPGVTQGNVAKVNTTTTQSAPMQKPKKSRGFLGFLNCCGMPDNANGVDSDEVPLPVKKVSKVTSQASPTSSKPESIPLQAGPSRTTAPLTEKDTIRQSEAVQSLTTDQEDVSQSAPRSKPGNIQGTLDRKASSKDIRNQPLPALPQEDKAPRNQSIPSNPSVVVLAPTPVRPMQEDSVPPPPQVRDQENALKDTVMTDAPPISTGETKAVSVEHRDTQSNASTLPPPPPLPMPEPVKEATNTSHEPTAADPAEEKQQWLLPPIEPRFQGKKCLVLDLDETLVHSSFKV